MSSITSAVRVLRCFSREEPELRLTDISRRLGLSKSNTHRIASLLVDARLLRRDPRSARYRLGLGLFELGALALSQVGLGPLPIAVMTELGRQTGETVLLGILDDYEVVYIHRVESAYLLRVSHAGHPRAPAHATATGKVLLAWRPDADVERVIRHGLPRYSDRTITDPAAFRAQLGEVRRQGHALSEHERETWTRAVAAPVRDAGGGVVAALTVAGPSQRLPRAQLPALVAHVVAAADRLSHQLATRPETAPPGLTRGRGPRRHAR
ncbi:MAG TPA: IclR family transcriptional regulator [Chloroflexota bacterium]|nr:IclR family transcriptional regulator [Chloroflexota bacterium]